MGDLIDESLLAKRSAVGAYHQLSEKHLQAYLDELEWRFNNRENPHLFRDTLMVLLKAETLPCEYWRRFWDRRLTRRRIVKGSALQHTQALLLGLDRLLSRQLYL